MLSSLLKEHQDKQKELKIIQEQKRKDAIAAANTLTQAMVDHLNVGVAQAYLNEKKIASEMKTLTHNSAQFAKQTNQWLTLIENFNRALKELGHVQSWAKAIDSDVKTISSCLEYVYISTQESSGGEASGVSGVSMLSKSSSKDSSH